MKSQSMRAIRGLGGREVRRSVVSEREIQKSVNSEVSVVNKQIGRWLSAVTGMVFGIVVVGGVTRLTESGLSITEWKPVTGSLPPFNEEDWASEFEKYRQFPEFQKLQPNMTLGEFKTIYFWEWSHRLLGRLIGVAFAVPFGYFVARKVLTRGQIMHYTGLLAFGGAQGALGWYMVKSGLEVKDGEYPRVSPYRLCAHLGTAFMLYMGLQWGAMSMFRPNIAVSQPINKAMKVAAGAFTALTFLTAMSGAFVAGLDAGLFYNEFPYMGDGFVPAEYWHRQPAWTNLTENGPAVQFNHRVLGVTTFTAAQLFWLASRRYVLPRPTRLAINAVAGMAWLQASLGIATLLYFVPVPLAAAHQAGSLTLLTFSTWLLHTVTRRKPITRVLQ
jgi:cytochrome c oxidase assembly protein subunit 15